MAMTVLRPQYSKVGSTKYLTSNDNRWMGGRGASVGPQYQGSVGLQGAKYLRRGMGVGPTRSYGRSQTGSGAWGKYMLSANDYGKLGYSSTYRDVYSRVRYPGIAYRSHNARNIGDVVPGYMRTDIRTSLDKRYGKDLNRPTIWTLA